MNKMELAWLACAFDGEGWFSLGKNKNGKCQRGFQWKPHAAAANCSKAFLEEMKKIAGGGSICQPTLYEYQKNCKTQYRYYCGGDILRSFLPQIKPFIIIKKKQVNLLLEALDLCKNHKGKAGHGGPHDKRMEEIFQELKKLNKRGLV